MKLGVATYAFLWTHPLDAALKMVADWGFRRLELMTAPPHVWPRGMNTEDAHILKHTLDVHGLEVVALCPTFLDLNIASPNPGILRESITQIQETIHLARDLGATIVVVIPGRRHALVPQPFEQTWQTARGAIEECLVEAERCGILLGLENAPSFFVERSDQLRRMVEEIGSDHVRIVFDVANGAMHESLPQALETVSDYLVHVHLSDCDLSSWAHLPVGGGRLDFEEIHTQLQRIGFDGTSIIETTYLADGTGGVLTSKARLESIGWRA
jgi:sugar phosphate isomerase/epimerase